MCSRHFKMEDIRTAIKLLTPNAYMIKLDLQEAYYLVSIDNEHTKYLRFYFDTIMYEFLVLPFGLASAPHAFTKLMKPVATFLRFHGYKSVFYLDDSCCFGENYNKCVEARDESITLFTKLGFLINYEKSVLEPSQTCQFLGFVLNSRDMTLVLPDQKKQDILFRTDEMLNTSRLPIRSFARYLGILTAACPAVQYGWLHTKELERAKYLALLNNDDYDKIMNVPNDLCEDLLWWKKYISMSKNQIKSSNFELEIFTDASMLGWGAACLGEKSGGSWNSDEANHHINYLELLAAFFGLKSYASKLSHCQILMRIDNSTAIAYINRMGGVQFPHLNYITRRIWTWCERRNIFIFASYIKSSLNVEADSESRNIDIEWELNPSAFQKITNTFGIPEIDLFASRSNCKCEKYISWKRDPYAYNVDAFTVKWNMFFYAFPPFALILKVLHKITADEATGIVVVPNWPSQPWFPVFKSLTIRKTIIFPPDQFLLSSNFREVHPLHRHLSLAVSILSGKHLPDNKSRLQR